MAIDKLDRKSVSNLIVTRNISGKTLIGSTYDYDLFANGTVSDSSIETGVGYFFQCKYMSMVKGLEKRSVM